MNRVQNMLKKNGCRQWRERRWRWKEPRRQGQGQGQGQRQRQGQGQQPTWKREQETTAALRSGRRGGDQQPL